MKFCKSLSGRLRGRSIFARVLAGYVALTLFVVALTAALSYILVQGYVTDSNRRELLDKAQSIAATFGRRASPDDQSGRTGQWAQWGGRPPLMLREFEAMTGARVIVVTPDLAARLLIRSPDRHIAEGEDESVLEFPVIDALDQAMVRSILAGNVEAAVRRLAFLGVRVLFAGAPIQGDGGVLGAVILYRPLTDIRGFTVNISVMLAIAGVLSLLLAVGLSLYLSRRLTRPLILMTATAKRMADGHYGERVPIAQSGDEIGQLGTTLNLLSGRLSAVIARLSDEKGRLQQILSSLGEGIVAVDRDGSVVHHNATALELMELDQWLPGGGAPPRQAQMLEMLGRAMADGARAQTTWHGALGRSIAATVYPVTSAEGETIGAVALMRDVSEAERMEQLRRDYVANISHELRTPLTGIRGMVEPLMDGYIDTEAEKAECYRVIYQETLRLQKLIGEMLDMSRLQDGRQVVELEPMELPGVMEGAARRMRDRALAAEVNLAVLPDGDLPPVMGNEDRIMQVLIILLDNALGFTPAGGSVDVYARRRGDVVALGVRDSGVGIDPKDLPHIWERFYKADRSRLHTPGTGLGLSIAKLVVELMGGEISVRSEPGRGATFEFTLRACAAPDTDG
ncbi:MAG: cell wall metabolism sensor histidine kinase WalK [Clostridiales bacterium]|nr:cell wall metabolism sensor histidine kinase WalK [Clostridiales bacterium]